MTALPTTPYDVVRTALTSQRCLVLDGGVASELEHHHGQENERLWAPRRSARRPVRSETSIAALPVRDDRASGR
jgi:hypothetical protein